MPGLNYWTDKWDLHEDICPCDVHFNDWVAKEKLKNKNIYHFGSGTHHVVGIKQAERKNRTKAEVDQIICWLTGYDQEGLQEQIDKGTDFETFFAQAPKINPNVSLIKGVVCGIRVEEIEDPLMQKIRYLDKLVDELAKGRPMEKILRG